MKKVKLNGAKLHLLKETIASLSSNESARVVGGYDTTVAASCTTCSQSGGPAYTQYEGCGATYTCTCLTQCGTGGYGSNGCGFTATTCAGGCP